MAGMMVLCGGARFVDGPASFSAKVSLCFADFLLVVESVSSSELVTLSALSLLLGEF